MNLLDHESAEALHPFRRAGTTPFCPWQQGGEGEKKEGTGRLSNLLQRPHQGAQRDQNPLR